jgi:serine/threonine protein kinase
MTLPPGTTLGSYEVTAKLGEGGMGEVYGAEDTKLGRQVAIKVLPEAFAKDPERLARFDRKARVLAALDHANIAAIYGLEEAEGRKLLIMQLAEGETLAERIGRGPIPVDEALPIALQIAEALEAAHEKGIIHRDLKPANVKVTQDGRVKVLDFGLAKALEPESTSEGEQLLTQSPTLTAQMTGAGVLLGTAAYMSPEQARGQPLDKRADVWAFGCVLYEMLTGKLAFAGATTTDVLAAVV